MAKTPKVGQKVTIRKGKKPPISFNKGGLHTSTGTPQDQKIPAYKIMQALAGKLGPKAKKQAVLAKGALAKGQKTAAAHRRNK